VLIVNADDLGYSRTTTDAIIGAFDAGGISCASALVWMGDSERAAEIAAERGLEVGLHLNLTLPFGGDHVPTDVAERQAKLTQVFTKETWWDGSAVGVDPAHVQAAVDDQLERFRSTFGEPAFVNGHHHIHLADVVLDALPQLPVRQVPTTPGRLGDADARMAKVMGRFSTPWATLDIGAVHPALGGSGLDVLLAHPDRFIEIVAHAHMGQSEALAGADWRQTITAVGLARFADL
jgi:predicted glycoside hydrolase/deacetylase ChbG (UPF0249 family)